MRDLCQAGLIMTPQYLSRERLHLTWRTTEWKPVEGLDTHLPEYERQTEHNTCCGRRHVRSLEPDSEDMSKIRAGKQSNILDVLDMGQIWARK